jgi:hypothetical protein
LYDKGLATGEIPSFEAIDQIQGRIFDPHGDPIWVSGERAWTPLDGMRITPRSAVTDGSNHVVRSSINRGACGALVVT